MTCGFPFLSAIHHVFYHSHSHLYVHHQISETRAATYTHSHFLEGNLQVPLVFESPVRSGYLVPGALNETKTVRNGLSLFHGIQANCASAREKKGMRALEEVAPRMIKQCDI